MRIARQTGRLAALALVAGALVSVTGAAPALAEDAVAGGLTASPADTLFPNQGNSGYDVSHYDIAFRVDIGVSSSSGVAATTTLSDSTTTITASTTGAPLSSYSFDFQGTTSTLDKSTFNVDAVTVNGVPATFTRIENTTTGNATTDVHKLVVTPATPVTGAFTTVVTTSGRPVIHTDTDSSLEGWNNTVDGASFVNQPIGSMTLFPNNNTPRDKATYTWTVNAPTTSGTSNFAQAGGKPSQVGVVSNGELLSRTPSADGSRTTWVWDQQEQQASELSLFSVGRYDIYTSNITLASGRTIPEWTFIDPAATTAQITTTLGTRAQLKQMLDFYESRYGPYPGNSTGLVTDNTVGINYALETQDRPFSPNSASRGTTYHEIMHQWFGDQVSPYDWNDIWLNEGPATYSETQFPYEGAGSTTAPGETTVYNSWNSSSTGSSLWSVPVAKMTQASQLFGSPTYTRGNMTLYALRTAIGADTFATLMETWQTRYGGTSRTTAEFIDLAEEISGKDLTSFFQTWVYTTGKPAWPVRYAYDVTGPTTQVDTGDSTTFTLSTRNTGKVAMAAGAAVISVDVSALTTGATLGTLPADVTQSGDTLTWTVPATAVGATSTVDIPVTATGGSGTTLTAVVSTGPTVLGGTCVDCTASVRVGTAPIAVTPAPTIDGLDASSAPVVGQTLTATTAGWDSGTTFTYQWYVDGAPVRGATSATWTPTVEVVGYPVTVKVVGTQAGRNPASVTSTATALGVRGTLGTATPTVTGTPKIGEKLTVDPGAWQAGTVFTYQWRANGTNISGATGPVYTPAVSSQVGQTIDAVVTGTRAGYTTASQTSAATAAVVAGEALSVTPTPELTGTPKVGAAYSPVYGYWDDGVTLTYQWKLNGTNVSSGGTAAAITPTAAMLGQPLTVTVTGTRPGVTPVSVTSAASTPVANGTQVLQPTPTLSTPARAESVVTAAPGTWDTGTTRTYRWLVDGTAVDGATGTTYTPTLEQIGKALTFEVTSTRTAYDTVVVTSAPATVVGLAQTLTPTPAIEGTPQVGVELTAVPGTWDDGTSLAYQWSADGEAIEGATSATYTPGAGRLGAAITVAVTSTKTDHETVTRTSEPTSPVVKGVQVGTPVPTITGTPKVGVELTAVPGTWDDGTSLAYQWYAGETAIEGATSATYTPGPGRLGDVLTVAVTGTRTGYEDVTRTSEPTSPVVKGEQVSTPVPTITGTPKVAVELTAVPGTWDDGTSLAYQWYAGETAIEGATSATYTPGPGRLGDVLTVAVTGTRTGYEDVTRTSAGTAAVVAGTPTSAPVPTITGTPKVGVQLSAVPGAWDDGTTLAYQWYAGGTAVDGATSATWTPGANRAGSVVTVAVTGTRTGYETLTRTSAATAAIVVGDQTLTPTPTVTGTPKVGVQLTAVPGTWDTGTTLTYQWYAGGSPVSGATGSTFTPTPSQVGTTVTVAVTAAKTGYASVTRTSAATGAVGAGDQVSTPTPTITGTAKVGVALTAVPGSWDSGTTLSYQWFVGGTSAGIAPTFTPRPVDLGSVVTVAVTGTKAGYATVTRTSAATPAVVAGDLVATPVPTVTGTPQVGVELTAVPGEWDNATSLAYQWAVDGTDVPDATAATFTPAPGDLAGTVTVTVTGSRTGYASVSRTSDATSAIAAGALVATPVPTVAGTVQVGRTVTAVPGAWDDGVVLSYQWRRGGTAIPGATGPAYEAAVADRGARLSVVVTGAKDGYVPVVRTSADHVVAVGQQTRRPKPRITGTVVVGRTLKVAAASYDPGVKRTYTWYAGSKVVRSGSASTFKLTKKYVGDRISVKVTATRTGYATVALTSAKSKPVKAAVKP